MEIESQRLQGPKYHQCPPSKEAKAFLCDPGNGWDLELFGKVVLESFKFCPYCGEKLSE